MNFISECVTCDECNKPFKEGDNILIVEKFDVKEIIPAKSAKMIHSERCIMDGDLYRASSYCSIKCLIDDMGDMLE